MDDVIRPNRTALPAIVISGCVKHPNLVGEIGINGKNTENGGAECEERASLGDNNVEKGVRTAFLSEGGGPHFFFFFFFYRINVWDFWGLDGIHIHDLFAKTIRVDWSLKEIVPDEEDCFLCRTSSIHGKSRG